MASSQPDAFANPPPSKKRKQREGEAPPAAAKAPRSLSKERYDDNAIYISPSDVRGRGRVGRVPMSVFSFPSVACLHPWPLPSLL